MSGLKASRAHIQESQRAVKNRNFALKVVCKISSTEAGSESSLNQSHLLILENLLEKQEATVNFPGDIDADSSHFGELILP